MYINIADLLDRGVANHKIRKALRDAQREGGSRQKEYLTPQAVAAAPMSDEKSQLLSELESPTTLAKQRSRKEDSHTVSELESPTAYERHPSVDGKSEMVSELDSTPVDSLPPSYAEVQYQDSG